MGNYDPKDGVLGLSKEDPLLKNISPRANQNGDKALGYSPITSGLSPYTGTFGRDELLHLLKRTLYGVRKEDVDYFSGQSLSAVLNELLSNFPTTLPSTPLNDYNSPQDATYPDPEHVATIDWMGVPQGQTWVNNPCNQNVVMSDGTTKNIFAVTMDNFARDLTVKKWNMGLAINQSRSVYEKLVLFWHNHFPISVSVLNRAQRSFLYTKLIRENVTTSLKEMCIKITKDPAMLMYLNGEVNTSRAPDENYARELQELFTIGKEVPLGNRYTEDDVKAAAAVLTGHVNAPPNNNYLDAAHGYNTRSHTVGNKQFSAFYSNTVITGAATTNTTTAATMESELTQLMDMIFDDTDKAITTLSGTPFAGWSRADIIADYIVKKIYRFFVYYDIDDNIKTNVIKPLADIYKNNNFQIVPVLQTLFASQHFFDMENRGCYIKMPMDVVVGLLRATNANLTDPDPIRQYSIFNSIFQQASDMQQGFLEPPNVAGWSPYYQFPQYHELWINSDTFPKRQSFGQSFSGNTPRGVYTAFNIKLDHIAFVKTLTNPGDPNALIDELNDLLLGMKLSAAHKQKLKTDTLLNKQTSDHYWTDAWIKATASNATTQDKNTVVSILKNLMDYLVRIEEFQLM